MAKTTMPAPPAAKSAKPPRRQVAAPGKSQPPMNVPSKKGAEARTDAKAPAKRVPNPDGNPGHHPSTRAFEHGGYKHSSEDR